MDYQKKSSTVTRRTVLKGAAAAVSAPLVFSDSIWGANNKVNIAWVGFNQRGWNDVRTCAHHKEVNVVAMCDCDTNIWPKAQKQFPKAKFFQNFREMLEKMGDSIDAVGVSTPDHNHFAVVHTAMSMGKHVFVQKPMTHSLWECRTLQSLAKKKNLVTQMGNQARAWQQTRMMKEWVEAGLIGDVKEVLTWTDRPNTGWGFPGQKFQTYAPGAAVPKNLDWDLWLGPTNKKVAYNPTYHPKNWRAWWDFGCGGLGDIGCHTIDAPWWSLDLGAPESVEVEMKNKANNIYSPSGSIVTFKFPARGKKAPVAIKWFEGPSKPTAPEGYDGKISGGGGMIMVGSDGGIAHQGMRPGSIELWPKNKWAAYRNDKTKWIPEKYPRVKSNIQLDFIDAIRENRKACSDFSQSGPLTEVILLGTLAIRTGKGLGWDPKTMTVKNNPEAQKLVEVSARKGWAVGDLGG
jgi:predicted dehydrogenase